MASGNSASMCDDSLGKTRTNSKRMVGQEEVKRGRTQLW